MDILDVRSTACVSYLVVYYMNYKAIMSSSLLYKRYKTLINEINKVASIGSL